MRIELIIVYKSSSQNTSPRDAPLYVLSAYEYTRKQIMYCLADISWPFYNTFIIFHSLNIQNISLYDLSSSVCLANRMVTVLLRTMTCEMYCFSHSSLRDSFLRRKVCFQVEWWCVSRQRWKFRQLSATTNLSPKGLRQTKNRFHV